MNLLHTGWDVALFRFINGTLQTPPLDLLMPYVTMLGDKKLLALLCAGFLIGAFFIPHPVPRSPAFPPKARLAERSGTGGIPPHGPWGSMKRSLRVWITVCLAFISAGYATILLKNAVKLPRPFVILQGVHLLEHEANPYRSFPSGHAACAFAVAFILSRSYKRYGWIFITLALLVGFSRVYLGVHFPSDVIAGALVGITAGWAVSYANKKIGGQKF